MNDEACPNIQCISLTFSTFQPLMSWSNDDAELNIWPISWTFSMLQAPIF